LEAERTILLDEQVKPRGFRQIIYNSFTPSFCKCVLDKNIKTCLSVSGEKLGYRKAPDEGPEVFEGETMLPELDMSLGTATAVSAAAVVQN